MYQLIFKNKQQKGVWQIIHVPTKRVILEAYKWSEASACFKHIDLILDQPPQKNLNNAATSYISKISPLNT